MNLEKDDFFVLFVGGFIPRKGADRVSKAIEKLNDSRLKVAFVGKAMGRAESHPSCKGIIFQGTLEHDSLPDYYRAADVFCLPTLNEGCCNAIVESLSCGTPVISSNRPFNADILNTENSILIDPQNVDELSDALEKMMNDKALYRAKKNYVMAHSIDYSIKARATKIKTFILDKCR